MSKPNDRTILKRQQYDPITPRTPKKPNVSTTPKDVLMENVAVGNLIDQALNHPTMTPELRQQLEKAKAWNVEAQKMLEYSPHRSHNVDCTECKRAITVRLFTCLECDAYHLCHECERAGHHVAFGKSGYAARSSNEENEAEYRSESRRTTRGNEMRTNIRTYCGGGGND